MDTKKILTGSEVSTNPYQGTFITKLVCLVAVTSKKIRSTDFMSPSTRATGFTRMSDEKREAFQEGGCRRASSYLQ